MPYYKGVIDKLIEDGQTEEARGLARKLLSLRHRLANEIPARNVLSSILLATWNIREFGADHKAGRRLDESLLCIAEIISHFDLVAVQEVNAKLDSLQRMMRLLGNWWEYLVTDVTLGASGNSERIAFVYDGRKVSFDHLAGELALPPAKRRQVRQPARSPFICSFRVGWRRVALCSVHIYYGHANPNDPVRVQEIRAVSGALAKRNKNRLNQADGEPESVVLLGDFNIFNKMGDKTSKALEANHFVVPDTLAKLPLGGNLARDKHFDQIAFHDPRGRLKTSRAGIFDFQSVIYGPDDADFYRSAMKRSAPAQFTKASRTKETLTKFYRQWRTFQLSDHLPLWVELKTDFADNYLGSVLKRKPHELPAKSKGARLERMSPVDTPPPIANATPKPSRKKKKAR